MVSRALPTVLVGPEVPREFVAHCLQKTSRPAAAFDESKAGASR